MWWRAILTIIILGLVGAGIYFLTPQTTPSPVQSEGEVGGIIEPLYFYSYSIGDAVSNCPAAVGINWQIAIIALSDYMQYGDGAKNGEDIGPAEIQRNFDENCDRNIAIYNRVKEMNPDLFNAEE